MNPGTVRDARPEDAEAIADILVSTWRSAYLGLIDPGYLDGLDRDRYARVYREAIRRYQDRYLVGEEGGTVQGFVSGNILAEGEYDCEVKELYVRAEAQGRGLGGSLLAAMMAFFREAGLKRMIVWALQGAANNGFYRRQGGLELVRKETDLGGRSYPLVGFVFPL